MTMHGHTLEKLRLMGLIGLDLSPGDPVCQAAYEEIIQMQKKIEKLEKCLWIARQIYTQKND